MHFFLSEILKCQLLHVIWEKEEKNKPKIVVNTEFREDRTYLKHHNWYKVIKLKQDRMLR